MLSLYAKTLSIVQDVTLKEIKHTTLAISKLLPLTLVLLRLYLCQALQTLARFQKVAVGKLCLQEFVALVGILLAQILCVVTKMYF